MALAMLAACVPLTGATVVMVSEAVPPAVVVMLTLEVVAKLSVGGFAAPAGLDVTTAVRATVPVNPPAGLTLIVDWFPEVAPAATETAVPEIAIGRATLTVPAPVALL